MKQLTQKLGSGAMNIQDIPYPQVGAGYVVVKNHYSIISAGTEGATVQAARKSLIGKAKERPQQVKQVLEVLKKQGIVQTYRAVTKKLDAYSPLGYSCAGEVIEVGENVTEFAVGDLVACAGAGYANHAEVVCVPVNLTVKLAKNANLKNASYNTLGAIAMQGVRQADMRLGETCVVIGLGLLGQLTCLILKASGINVIGIDISENAVANAHKNAVIDYGWARNTAGIENKIANATQGHGADVVLIAAATTSLDPINFAGAVARKKGTVVVLGAIPTGFNRDPDYYRKELELKMACSYGPGRYDINYEEKGIDYPIAYVRWTEKRNMEAFQELLAKNRIDISYLSTHEFDFENAADAYELIVNKTAPYIGLVLKYDASKVQSKDTIVLQPNQPTDGLTISFIGAGSYAQGNLLPNIPNDARFQKTGILTNNGTTSKRVAEKFKFEFCASSEDAIFSSTTNTLFVATRHDSHAKYVLKGLNANQNIFVEKPLCLYESEMEAIETAQQKCGKALMIGFNRRFSPLSQEVKNKFGSGPMAMIYRINAGSIAADNWIQDLEIGGGRIIGEVCHFIDYLTFINGSLPIKVSASALPDANNLNDTVTILILFENGSTGTIAYFANGSKELSKEYVEIYCAGQTAIIDDFKKLELFGKGKTTRKKLFSQNKGQKEMVTTYLENVVKNGTSAIPQNEIFAVMHATFRVINSIENGGKQIDV